MNEHSQDILSVPWRGSTIGLAGCGIWLFFLVILGMRAEHAIYLTPKIQDLKYQVNMYRCADEKISKTENKVTVANCDVEVVENLDHQN